MANIDVRDCINQQQYEEIKNSAENAIGRNANVEKITMALRISPPKFGWVPLKKYNLSYTTTIDPERYCRMYKNEIKKPFIANPMAYFLKSPSIIKTVKAMEVMATITRITSIK